MPEGKWEENFDASCFRCLSALLRIYLMSEFKCHHFTRVFFIITWPNKGRQWKSCCHKNLFWQRESYFAIRNMSRYFICYFKINVHKKKFSAENIFVVEYCLLKLCIFMTCFLLWQTTQKFKNGFILGFRTYRLQKSLAILEASSQS